MTGSLSTTLAEPRGVSETSMGALHRLLDRPLFHQPVP